MCIRDRCKEEIGANIYINVCIQRNFIAIYKFDNYDFTDIFKFSKVCSAPLSSCQFLKPGNSLVLLHGVSVRTLDSPSKGREFDSRSGRCQVIVIGIGDCLRTGNNLCMRPTRRST